MTVFPLHLALHSYAVDTVTSTMYASLCHLGVGYRCQTGSGAVFKEQALRNRPWSLDTKRFLRST